MLFYVGSIFVVVAVTHWDDPAVAVSPYAATLRVLGIPAVTTIMNLVVLTAVLSCLNSALYTSSRMLFALTRHGDAPRAFTTLSAGGVPRRAILAGTVLGFASVVAAYVSPDEVFAFLINSYGAVALFVYLAIAVSQVVLHRRLEREQGSGGVRMAMWFFPWLSYLTIALMAAVIVAMAFIPDTRSQFWLSLVTVAVVLVAYEVRRRYGPTEPHGSTDARSPAA